MKVVIVDYRPEYRDSIRILNEAWLTKYFRIEDSDIVQLGDPEREILDKGGCIYYAQLEDGSIVGVAALMYMENGVFELSKMAVDERFQGLGVGRKLAETCLAKADVLGAKKVFLYSNSRLERAIQLYQHLGFEFIDLGKGHYERADVKMSLSL